MSKTDKMLKRMRNNPKDWNIDQLEAVADSLGIISRRPSGSHVTFSAPGVAEHVTVPAHRPIKPVYVRAFLRLVDQVKG